MDGITCSTEDCGNEVRRNGLCWTCVKRQQRKLPVSGERKLPRGRAKGRLGGLAYAKEVSFDFLDLQATDQEGWRKAMERFRWALRQYSREQVDRELKKLCGAMERIKGEIEGILKRTNKKGNTA